MADKYIGKLLDNRYEILEIIGTGGMAVVYKALCHRLNRYVAVKILKDEYAKDEEFRNRFHAESHAVAMLQHPNIVAVYDVSRSNSIEYIVMELIDGMTLKQYMERRGVLSQKEAIHFTTQILKALAHAHSRGIIHRDIKPHNIMLLRDSTVKVADFGIARLESSQRTITREAFGSVHYISPEQARGSNIDCRTDIYSTGVVMYEMLTGRLPFEGDTPVSVAIQHINSLPLNPREINPEIPESLEKIIMKAMAPSVSKRYSSAEEMLRDIEEFRKDPLVTIDYSSPSSDADQDIEKTRKIQLSDEDIPDIDDDDTYESSKGIKTRFPAIAAIAAGIVFLAGIVTLAATFIGSGGSSKSVDVPNIIGMTIDEASNEYRDFEIIEKDEDLREYSAEYDEGYIIKQSPKADEETTSRKIYVTLSRGKRADSVVPSELINMSKEQAQIVADREGFFITFEEEASDDIAEGNVIRTVPEAGSELGDDRRVTAYVSTGKSTKDAVVPYVIGLTEEKAVLALESAKLAKGSIDYENSDTAKGLVIKQTIASGETREEGTSVGLTISLGPKQQTTTPASKPSAQKPSTAPSSGAGDKQDDGTVTITRSIRLPSDPSSFTVKITVNGITQYEKQHSGSDGSVNVSLKGKGPSTVCVYINNVLRQEIPIDFK